jgi:hypothetical protein
MTYENQIQYEFVDVFVYYWLDLGMFVGKSLSHKIINTSDL